jgi:uncharacterized protein YceH (UPF0502 family)
VPNSLHPIERRIVGVLLEKVLATPSYYPLTLKALTAGCNQKNNRDPEMELGEDEVQRTLVALQAAGLAVSVCREGERVEKWKTAAREVYGLPSEKAMAVFAELLLRGPVTKAELRTRASRMRHEIAPEDLEAVLADFAGRPDRLIQNLGRAPGGRVERFAHTLYAEEEVAALRAAAPAAAPAAEGPRAGGGGGGSGGEIEALQRELASLRERVAALERSVGIVVGNPDFEEDASA